MATEIRRVFPRMLLAFGLASILGVDAQWCVSIVGGRLSRSKPPPRLLLDIKWQERSAMKILKPDGSMSSVTGSFYNSGRDWAVGSRIVEEIKYNKNRW